MARLLADNITKTINNGDIIERSERPTVQSTERPQVNVFPYSIFYVFYEQYLTMFEDTLRSLGISIGAVFIVTFILSGFDLMTSIVTILVIIMILVNLGENVVDLCFYFIAPSKMVSTMYSLNLQYISGKGLSTTNISFHYRRW